MRIEVELQDKAGWEKEFTNLKELEYFLSTEVEFYEKNTKKIKESGNGQGTFLGNLSRLIALQKAVENISEKQVDESNVAAFQKATATSANQLKVSSWVCSENPLAHKLVETNLLYGDRSANNLLKFVVEDSISLSSQNPVSKKDFIGYLLGYEYLLQDSDVTSRRNSEEETVEDLSRKLGLETQKLIKESDEFKNDATSWLEDAKETWSDTNQQRDEIFAGFLDSVKEVHENQQLENSKKILELENLYEEKLRLAAPAVYWKQAALKYRSHGIACLVVLLIMTLFGVVLFGSNFNSWLVGQQIGVKLDTITGIIMFGTLAAAYTYIIRVLAKLAFSSFHLMRDAEEREQLTHLYLALISENSIDKDSRDLVLQSLFSRSDTGLLGGDSGPTMPTVGGLFKNPPKP